MDDRKSGYACESISGGISVEQALHLMLATCNKHDTLFITDKWIAPRLETLRRLLADPITDDQAQALRDAAMKRLRLDAVIEWLELGTMPLADYVRMTTRISAELKEAEENRQKERHEEWLEELRAKPKPPCPRCHECDEVVPIIYGYFPLHLESSRTGSDCYVRGGCMVGRDSDRWWCKRCQAGFGRLGLFEGAG
jgi:hypothetical protein